MDLGLSVVSWLDVFIRSLWWHGWAWGMMVVEFSQMRHQVRTVFAYLLAARHLPPSTYAPIHIKTRARTRNSLRSQLVELTLICSNNPSCFRTSSIISSFNLSYFSSPFPKISSNHSVLTSPVPPCASLVASFRTSGRISSDPAICLSSEMMRARWDIASSSSSREARRGLTEGGRDEKVEEEVVEGIWSFRYSYSLAYS